MDNSFATSTTISSVKKIITWFPFGTRCNKHMLFMCFVIP